MARIFLPWVGGGVSSRSLHHDPLALDHPGPQGHLGLNKVLGGFGSAFLHLTPQLSDARFAWTVAKHVKSNAIVYAKNGATAGVGAGQMNRLESARIAAWKAKDAAVKAGWAKPLTVGSSVASDAFFPFADGLLAAVEAGATCVIQPGGSIRDDEVIAAADTAGLAMIFTGMRHFRH